MKTEFVNLMAVAMALCFSGCVEEMSDSKVAEDIVQEVKVTFDLEVAARPQTRSAIAADEDRINDVNIYIYSEGRLEYSDYKSEDLSFEARLRDGVHYNIYAIANTGRIAPPEKEEEITALRHAVENADGFNGLLPMAWVEKKVRFTKAESSLKMQLERLVSRISFSMDGIEGLRVKSVRLKQCAMEIFPFASGGSRTDKVDDCDFATEEDLDIINSGGEIFFYALENCHGTLLPDNADPWEKNPDRIGDKAGHCTYLEVMCSFDEGQMYAGDVTYRLYAGMDNCTNFDIRRNTDVGIRLVTTGEGLRKVSWLVVADVSVMSGYASGWVEQGLHNLDELYVGESFLCGFEVAEDLLGDYGGDVEALSLKFIPKKGKGGIEFGGITGNGDGAGLVEARCVGPAEGEIWLYGSSGDMITIVDDNVNILLPKLMLSSDPEDDENGKVRPLARIPRCEVNGKEDILYVYLADKEGRNLNAGYGFDLGLFGLVDSSCKTGFSGFKLSTLSFGKTAGKNTSGGYAMKLSYRAVNDGTDKKHNNMLVEAIFTPRSVKCEFKERNYGMTVSTDLDLDYCPVRLELVDNQWARHFSDVRYSLIIDNPSNIPLDVDAAQVIGWMTKWNGGYTASDVKNLKAEKFRFITDTYSVAASGPDMGNELYGSVVSVHSERNSSATRHVKSGSKMIHALDLDVENLSKIAAYNDGRKRNGLCHLFDVSSCGHDIERISIDNHLSNGSSGSEALYASYGNRGCWLYTNNRKIGRSGQDFNKYGCFKVKNLKEMIKKNKTSPLTLEFEYDGEKFFIAAKNIESSVWLDVHYEGVANGEVTTYPNGTWGKAVRNTCSVEFSGDATANISPSLRNYVIDATEIRAHVRQIYNYSFKDSNTIFGARPFQHRAHATSLSLKVKLKTKDAGDLMLPVKAVTLKDNENTFRFFHDEELKMYYPTYDVSVEFFEFTNVEEK